MVSNFAWKHNISVQRLIDRVCEDAQTDNISPLMDESVDIWLIFARSYYLVHEVFLFLVFVRRGRGDTLRTKPSGHVFLFANNYVDKRITCSRARQADVVVPVQLRLSSMPKM